MLAVGAGAGAGAGTGAGTGANAGAGTGAGTGENNSGATDTFLCGRGGAGTGRVLAPDAATSPDSTGDWLLVLPKALRALRTARWCLDNATEISSFVSISVNSVSSSGAGLVELMYAWMARDAD